MSEAEKRKHRCGFAGHRPEKIAIDEVDAKKWLEKEIRAAISEGYSTFVTGMAMGVDLWAGETVLNLKGEFPEIHLIAATPYPAFAARWKEEWKARYESVMRKADLRIAVCKGFEQDAFDRRNRWLVDHVSRVIAMYNGEDGGTKELLQMAEQAGLETRIEVLPAPVRKRKRKQEDSE